MLPQPASPTRAPEMWRLREAIRDWRFYDHCRTDLDAPVRSPRIGTHTPILSNDGADLAATLRQTIRDAFAGSEVEVLFHTGRFELTMRQPGLLRPLSIAELSEGTLRFLFWTAALLTPRPPSLMVLNELETSLHPDLLDLLARLAAALPTARILPLEKHHGETTITSLGLGSTPPWHWPSR